MMDLIYDDNPQKMCNKNKEKYENFIEKTKDSTSNNYFYKIFLCKRYMDSLEDLILNAIDQSRRNSDLTSAVSTHSSGQGTPTIR